MPKIEPEIETFARIKVIGAGGSGKNAINHMINSKVRGVDFLVANTDSQDLHHSLAKKKIHVGKSLTKGLGTGMNPELGRKAAEETREEIQEALRGADMVFVTYGLGGGTGTGTGPVIARTAKEAGALTVGVVTKPFFFEGAQRARIAEEGLENLRKEVDALIVIPNDRLFDLVDAQTSFRTAFAMCDEVLRQAVEGISDLITTPGIINVDFADIKAIMSNAGSALMGIGNASGEKRAQDAALAAINSPLLDLSINGAKGVLFAIAGGSDLTMHEIQDAAKVITESIDADAKVIFGAIQDDRLKKNEIKITVIASGFPEQIYKRSLFSGSNAAKEKPSKDRPVSESTEAPADRESILKKVSSAISSAGNPPAQPGAPAAVPAPEKQPEKRTIHNSIIRPVEDTSSKNANDDDDDWNAIPAFLRRQKK